jgi:hypothetical protein
MLEAKVGAVVFNPRAHIPGCTVQLPNMDTVPHISPLLALIIALLFGSIAASGKFSLNAANMLLFVAWGAGVFAVMQSGLKDRHLRIAAECGVGILAVLISYWVTQRHRSKSSHLTKR